MSHFVLDWNQVRSGLDADADIAVVRFRGPCEGLLRDAAAAGVTVSDEVLPRLCAAAEELELFVATVALNDTDSGEAPQCYGAWCSPGGELIGYGSLESCGAGEHGFHKA